MTAGRPTEYKKEYCDKVYEYLDLCQDTELVNKETEQVEVTRVKLPTLKGFARFIGVNESTIYEWDKKHPEFSKSLDEIRTEQHDRLVNGGLSGDYNPTIAKLILSSNHGMREKSDVTTDEKPIQSFTNEQLDIIFRRRGASSDTSSTD